MLSLINQLFRGRSRGIGGAGLRRGGLGSLFGGRRKGLALGTLASLAAPFIMRKLSARRSQRAGLGAL